MAAEDFKKLLLEHGLINWQEAIPDERIEQLKENLSVHAGETVLFAHDDVHQHNRSSGDYGFIVTERNIYFNVHKGRQRMTWFDLASYFGLRRDEWDDHRYLYLCEMDRPKLLCNGVGKNEEQKQTLLAFWRALHGDLCQIFSNS